MVRGPIGQEFRSGEWLGPTGQEFRTGEWLGGLQDKSSGQDSNTITAGHIFTKLIPNKALW